MVMLLKFMCYRFVTVTTTFAITVTTGCPTSAAPGATSSTTSTGACPEFTTPAVGTIAGMFFVGVIFGIAFGAVLVKSKKERIRRDTPNEREEGAVAMQPNGIPLATVEGGEEERAVNRGIEAGRRSIEI